MTPATAKEIATKAHEGQFRYDGTTPYITHPERVAARVAGDSDAEIVAWLHDVVEDTSVTLDDLLSQGVPDYLLEAVEAITHLKGEFYGDYIAKVAKNPLAVKVKIADLIDNLSDKPTVGQVQKYLYYFPQLVGPYDAVTLAAGIPYSSRVKEFADGLLEHSPLRETGNEGMAHAYDLARYLAIHVAQKRFPNKPKQEAAG